MSILTTDTIIASFILALAERCGARVFTYQHKRVSFVQFKNDLFGEFIERGLDLILIEDCHFEQTIEDPDPTVASSPKAMADFHSLTSFEEIAIRYNLFFVVVGE